MEAQTPAVHFSWLPRAGITPKQGSLLVHLLHSFLYFKVHQQQCLHHTKVDSKSTQIQHIQTQAGAAEMRRAESERSILEVDVAKQGTKVSVKFHNLAVEGPVGDGLCAVDKVLS